MGFRKIWISQRADFVDRKSVVQGKSVDLGGRRIIKKKKKTKIEKKKKQKKTYSHNNH